MACEPTGQDLFYDDIIALKQRNEIILIDVREPSEIQETGILPGSVHIPLGELKNALQVLSPADFLKKYGTDKPKCDANLVFSCRSGKRSRSAMETAVSIGFLNSRHYAGGFLDWQKHHPS
ncbi:thiosulfate sulfurtransferase/rhodanese-like domain-containing protein 3 isoform X2 [Cryptotermes secundus]|nr:thiosulfate sulfurtransferase/rhodanese-like domain-containing protein 3 isoform X2 [Cryptotermes secundus]